MSKKQSIFTLFFAIILIAVLGFTTIVGFGPTRTGAAKNIITGLDLSGGVSITYQVIGGQ